MFFKLYTFMESFRVVFR